VKLRYEDFGAIASIDDPPALLWIDEQMVRELGHPESPLWRRPLGHLSAPTEVHLMTTNRCPAGCPGCYPASTPEADDAPTAELKTALDRLAEMGVFHVAMGGGESLLRSDLFELAEHARLLGIVPNLTTSGIGMTPELAQRCRVFGQVNVSLDGLGEVYRASRGYDGCDTALRAIRQLIDAGVPCGVNFVLSQATWDSLDETVATVEALGANEVELLRFKPTGRGADVYERYRLSPDQASQLMPRVLALSGRHPALAIKIDCSLVPFLCASNPPLERLEQFAVFGCEAGHALAAVKADLQATPCSFVPEPIGGVDVLADEWNTHAGLGAWRQYSDAPPEPCASCTYRTVCKGGCKAVTRHLTGEYFGPDPECPRVSG